MGEYMSDDGHGYNFEETGASMSTRRSSIEARIARLQDELIRMDSVPPEPEVDGETPLIRFQVRFQKSQYGKVYDYAAIKAGEDGLWYTTGPNSPKGYTWAALWEWLEPKLVGELWIATGYGAMG